MASKYFYVHNGLAAGDLTIDADTGNINTTGTLTASNITISGNAVLTTASIASNAVSSITAGTDTAVSASVGPVTIWNTSTLQSVTNRGFTTTNRIEIANTTQSNGNDGDLTEGALIIRGGIGIEKDLHIKGDIHLVGTGTLRFGPYDVGASVGNTWWVRPGGLDLDPITVPGAGSQLWTAFASIKYALSKADNGDTVIIQPGVYTEIFPMTVPTGVSVRGAGLRECFIQPTTATNTQTAFFLGGETTISDFTIGNFFKPGYAFQFTPGAKISTRSPYIQRFSIITKGSVTSPADPYGFDAGDAGNGAYLDAGVLDPTSLEPSMLWNEATFIVPNAIGYYMTNGARAEMLNSFTYFADKSIYAKVGTVGFGGVGKTRLRVSGVTGTFTSSDTLIYKDTTGNIITTGTIASYDGTYIYLNGPVWGFDVVYDRVAKLATSYGSASINTSTVKFGSGSLNVTSSTGYVEVLSDNDFQFGTGNYTFESWIRSANIAGTQYIYRKGTLTTASISAYMNSSGNIVATHDTVSITGSTVLSSNTWYHIRVVRRTETTGIYLYINGSLDASNTGTIANVNNTDPLLIGNSGTSVSNYYWNGFIDDFRISDVARNTSTFVAPTVELKSDPATILLLHFNDAVGTTAYSDDIVATQNLYSTGTNAGFSTRILFADYHQFGAEIRAIGCATVFGNTGITADGTGTDLKLIAYNLSNIGSGKDLSNDYSLANSSAEIIQQNGGKIYYQTVDQNGDFKVGDSFSINQRTGAVSFGTANVNLGSLDELVISDGVNNATILPTSISVGNINLSGNTFATLSGNLTINPVGATTIIDSLVQVNDVINAASALNAISTISAAIVVTGGVGIGKDLRVGGTIFGNVTGIVTTATTATSAAIAYSLANTGTTYVGRAALADSATTATSAATAYSTIGIHTAGTGLSGSTFNGSANQTWTLNTATLMAAAVTATSAAIAYSVANTGSLYVGRATLSDSATTSTSAATAYSSIGTLTAGTGLTGSTFNGSANQTWTLNTATLMATAVNLSGGSVNATTGQFSGITTVTNTTAAISTLTGALQVRGGASIGGSLYVAGEIVADRLTIQFTTVTTTLVQTDDVIQTLNTTGASSTNTGALIVSGGVGVAGNIFVGGVVTATTFLGNLTGTASTATSAAIAYSLANTGTTYVGKATLADSATTATSAGTAYATIGIHTAGTGLSGSTFNGSANQTWTLNTATLMTSAVTATSAAIAYSSIGTLTAGTGLSGSTFNGSANQTWTLNTATLMASAVTATSAAIAYSSIGTLTAGTGLSGSTFNGSANQTWTLNTATLMAIAVTATSAAIAYSLANTGTTYVGRATLADSATTATSAATAYSSIGTLTAGTGLSGSTFNGSANQTWTLNTATLMASAVTATSAAIAYSLANTGTTYVGRATLADSATTATSAGTSYSSIGTLTAGTGLSGSTFNGSANQTWTLNTATLMASAVTATNLTGGAAGSIPYQTAAGVTTFLPIGTSTFVLQSNGGIPTWVSTSSLGITGGGGGSVGSPFNGIFTITNVTEATSTITGALQVAGGVGIGGNLNVGGNGVFGSSLNFTPVNANIQYGGNVAGFLQLAAQNANAGTTSTTDIVAFSDNGTNDGGYIDFGITSSAYSDPLYDLSGPGDGYLYVVGTTASVGKLTISTYQPQDIVFSTGGGDAIHEAGRWKHGHGLRVVTTTESTSTTTGGLAVVGGVGIGGNLNVGGTVTAPAVVAGNIIDAGKIIALAMGMAMP